MEEAIFEIGIIVLAVILYIGFGCLIDLKIIWSVIKRPIGPGIGFLSQFVAMPLVGKLKPYLIMMEFSLNYTDLAGLKILTFVRESICLK